MLWKNKYRPLIIAAIFTTPFIALFGITPTIMPILMQDQPHHFGPPLNMHHGGPPPGFQVHRELSLIPLAVITVRVGLIWIQNILLLAGASRFIHNKALARIARYVASFLIAAAIVIFLETPVIHQFILKRDEPVNEWLPVLSSFANNTLILFIIELLLIRFSETKIKIENAELKAMQVQAEHEKLLHQLQPHFIFNALNALKTLIRRNADEAEAYLVKLSEFLRFATTNFEQPVVSLKEELKFSLDYLQLQKTRFGDSLIYSINVPEEVTIKGKVPVFSVQLLIENCIKHNKFTTEQPLMIQVKYCSGMLEVVNSLNLKTQVNSTPGIGLKNLSDRYQYLSGQQIEIEKTSNAFLVRLKVMNV